MDAEGRAMQGAIAENSYLSKSTKIQDSSRWSE